MTAATITKVSKKKQQDSTTVERFYATGRRKEATARVWLKRGSGRFMVNKRTAENYFPRATLRMIMRQPFAVTDTVDQFDVCCTVSGSGIAGQASAIKLGISRILDNISADYHVLLRKGGFLTRDSRKVERKKYGHKKARKSFQFSKR